MRNLFFTLTLFIFCIPFSVSAEMIVIQVNLNSLSYELSPTNYNNSPSNYDNSFLNYNNSLTNYDNSPSNYNNSPSNYENSLGGNRLYNPRTSNCWLRCLLSNWYFKYLLNVWEALRNFVPATNYTQSIFASENSIWCGTLGILNGRTVIALSQFLLLQVVIKSMIYHVISHYHSKTEE